MGSLGMGSPSIHRWVASHAEHTPDAPAVATPEMRLTYAELADRTRVLAAHLAAGGIGVGDRVLLALPNRPATVVAGLAVTAIGSTAVEVNRQWSAEVLTQILAQSGARAAFIWGHDTRTWGAILAKHSVDQVWVINPAESTRAPLVSPGDMTVHSLLPNGRVESDETPVRSASLPDLDPDAPALVLYTSGSTGIPHGVIQTHRNIHANTRSIVKYLELTASDRALLALPLHYCYGRSVLQTHLYVGGSIFLDDRFAFPRVVMGSIGAEGCTGFAGVPLTFEIIRRQVDLSSMTFPRLRYVTQAGGPMRLDTIRWAREAFHPAKLFVMYGQTEATARLSYLPPERAADKEGSIGIAIDGVELRIVDEQGQELPSGEIGQVVAHGENVTPGYLDDPQETAAILRDGWLWTGDLAYRDDEGFFYHRGRAKEILKIGGYRVSPIELEAVVAGHPDVIEAGVCGVADELMGEVPVACVMISAGSTVDETGLREFCRERLAPYAVPRRFIVVDALPRNEAGKLLRAELRALAAQPEG